MEKYLVVWMADKMSVDLYGNEFKEFTDHYKAFTDYANNLELATDFYNKLLKEDDVYSANVCLIVKSTDY